MLHRTEDGVGVRVLLSGSEFPDDLETLMRQLDARLLGDRLEVLEPMLYLAVRLVARFFLVATRTQVGT